MPHQPAVERSKAFLFDLDGTLIDSVYEHVLAGCEALRELGIELPTWRIYRRVGMSGGLILNALQRETGRKLTKHGASEAVARGGLPKTSCASVTTARREGVARVQKKRHSCPSARQRQTDRPSPCRSSHPKYAAIKRCSKSLSSIQSSWYR